MDTMYFGSAVILAAVAYFVFSTALHIHGIVLSFRKKWYLGAVALVVPGFAVFVSLAKLIFKKDILE